MKKSLFLAVFLLTTILANAQFNFGIKAGYTSSLDLNNIGTVTTGQYNLRSVSAELSNGFHAGIFTRFSSGHIYFQPELLYAMGKKNYTISFTDATNNSMAYDKYVNISTVEVPLLLGLKVLDLKVANLRVFAGPKLRFNSGSTLEFRNLVGGNLNVSDLQQDVRESQIGLEAGVGVDILMLTLDARYNLIRDMYQTRINSLTIDNIPANTFVISLGWKIF